MPQSLRDWLAGGHLVWCVLDAVEQIDLSAFNGEYREDGWGRAAHDHSDGGCGGSGSGARAGGAISVPLVIVSPRRR